MTQEQSNQNECQILIYSVQDFLARHSLSPESEKDLLTQEELSLKSGVGLRFVRALEQGKETLRLDKVNQLLDFFNYEMVATSKIDNQ